MITFDKEYKLMAVKRVKESEKSVAAVARELDLNPNTLHGWISKYGRHGDNAFPAAENYWMLIKSCVRCVKKSWI